MHIYLPMFFILILASGGISSSPSESLPPNAAAASDDFFFSGAGCTDTGFCERRETGGKQGPGRRAVSTAHAWYCTPEYYTRVSMEGDGPVKTSPHKSKIEQRPEWEIA